MFTGKTTDGKEVVGGAFAFELRATHGLPLDILLDIMRERDHIMDWAGFIGRARANGWWDFQTERVMREALRDSGWDAEPVMERFMQYVLRNPHA